MDNWPHVCYHRSHWGSPVLAHDHWHLPSGAGFYSCRKHSQEYGGFFRMEGYTWEQWRGPSPAQSSSEREPS